MGIFDKLFKLSKNKISDVEEKLDSRYGVDIAYQELRDSKSEVANAIKELFNIGATKKMREERLNNLKIKIQDYEEKAILCIQKNEEELALEISNKIFKLKEEIPETETEINAISKVYYSLKENIDIAKKNIQNMETKLRELKANQKLNSLKSLSLNLSDFNNTELNSKRNYIQKLIEKQDFENKKFEVQKEYEDENNLSIDEKLKKSNILNKQNEALDILEQLKIKAKL